MKIRLSVLATAGVLTVIIAAIASLQFTDQSIQAQIIVNDPATTASSTQTDHPDEPIDETLNQRFSLNNSLARVQQIHQALISFRQLTEKSQTTLGRQTMSVVGNTDSETQTLGFHNWVGSVEGTLRKQDYQIKKLELELAQKQYQDGEISQGVLDQKATAYQTAEREFKIFWKSFTIAD